MVANAPARPGCAAPPSELDDPRPGGALRHDGQHLGERERADQHGMSENPRGRFGSPKVKRGKLDASWPMQADEQPKKPQPALDRSAATTLPDMTTRGAQPEDSKRR